jgi:zinc transporter
MSSNGLICAFLRPSDGEWREIGWNEIKSWQPDDGLIWIHLDRSGDDARSYLKKGSGLDTLVHENLLAEETRPRAIEMSGNLLINLRGVNLNPGANPEDMVSVRVWIEINRIISSRHRPLMAVNDIREQIARGRGPKKEGDFLIMLADRLVARMSPVLEDLDEAEDDLEDQMVTGGREEIRTKLAEVRRQAIGLRRYLSPQREALSRVHGEPLEWLDVRQKARLREISDRIIRYVEDLDAIRERAAIIQDEVANRVAEQINTNMYRLAIVATVMLPLGLLTGLLGINVDGMPGSKDAPWAFGVVTGLLFFLIFLEIVVMRKLKWF